MTTARRRRIDVDGWIRYQAIHNLIAFLQDHPEMIHNIRVQHRKNGDGECFARCGEWPCLLRCCAEESLRQPKRKVK
jgi:hypothetical protein